MDHGHRGLFEYFLLRFQIEKFIGCVNSQLVEQCVHDIEALVDVRQFTLYELGQDTDLLLHFINFAIEAVLHLPLTFLRSTGTMGSILLLVFLYQPTFDHLIN